MPETTLKALREDYNQRSKGSLSLPIAGALVWAVVAVLGLIFSPKTAVLALVFATGAIFPIALSIAHLRGEQLFDRINPLSRLMGSCVLMVNLLWGLHIPLIIFAPEFVPLSLGIGLGLHWVVYSWIIAHPLGLRHAIGRSVGLVAVWLTFPEYRVTACALIVVLSYAISLIEMRSRLVALTASKPATVGGAA